MATSVRVSRDKLIAALRAKHKALADDHEEAVKEYKEGFAPWQAAAVAALTDAVKLIKSAKEPGHIAKITDDYGYRSKLSIDVGKGLPSKPRKPDELDYIERAIQRLEMCPDEVLSLSDKDDYFRYL